jgi:hypothetical protein
MRTLALLVAIAASVTLAAESEAQTQVPPRSGEQTPAQRAEKTVEGQVGSVDSSRTAITLTDGTKLVTPPGATIRPGALIEGMIVIASYREENGEKVLTEITVKDRKPSGTPSQN